MPPNNHSNDNVSLILAARRQLDEVLRNFDALVVDGTIRDRVKALVPAFHKLRGLGCVLVPDHDNSSARDRILAYFKLYPHCVISGDEILVVSGIQEYARRIRELRVQFGWKIASGIIISEDPETAALFPNANVSDYVLLDEVQDRDAAFRWHSANSIRREDISVRDKILKYLKENVGKAVTGEELRYLAGDRTEWARRVRELRTEFGWSVSSHQTGRPDLPVGTYVLETLEQLPEHDRHIRDAVQVEVLERDHFRCVECGWRHEDARPSDPRTHLELHHVRHHANGGSNEADNLTTLCNVCHRRYHAH